MEKKFENKEELFAHLKANKALLVAEKKSETKQADAILFGSTLGKSETKTTKSPGMEDGTIRVKSVINTTGVMDSHSDVHIKGIWNKSLKENKNIYLLQEHQMKFDKVISDQVKASAEMMKFTELGVNSKSETQALVFDSIVSKERNEFMFNQYKNGFVKNHSVGMQYVKIDLAINSNLEEYKEEKAIWDKYEKEIVNREKAEEQGYFWAVTEAKIIEGSAVLVGSNTITPTLSVESKEFEPSDNDTRKTKPVDTTSKHTNNTLFN